ncbi:MAG: pyridoxamine 5'-phosphate oxidase family protein [bacterium]
MGKIFEAITPELAEWIGRQRMFFVATAPLAADGLVNCSPKGMDAFRILGPREVAYLDLTGSGIETIAHLRENRRIVFMFCAFDGPPKIVRLHGAGSVVALGEPGYDALRSRFPEIAGARAIVRAEIARIGDSCGWGVPLYDFVAERDTLVRAAESKGDGGLAEYRALKNARSLDGLPGLDPHTGAGAP